TPAGSAVTPAPTAAAPAMADTAGAGRCRTVTESGARPGRQRRWLPGTTGNAFPPLANRARASSPPAEQSPAVAAGRRETPVERHSSQTARKQPVQPAKTRRSGAVPAVPPATDSCIRAGRSVDPASERAADAAVRSPAEGPAEARTGVAVYINSAMHNQPLRRSGWPRIPGSSDAVDRTSSD